VNRLPRVETKQTNEKVHRKMLSAPRKTKQHDSQGHILEKTGHNKGQIVGGDRTDYE